MTQRNTQRPQPFSTTPTYVFTHEGRWQKTGGVDLIQEMIRADANKHLVMMGERVDTLEESFDVRIDGPCCSVQRLSRLTEKKLLLCWKL